MNPSAITVQRQLATASELQQTIVAHRPNLKNLSYHCCVSSRQFLQTLRDRKTLCRRLLGSFPGLLTVTTSTSKHSDANMESIEYMASCKPSARMAVSLRDSYRGRIRRRFDPADKRRHAGGQRAKVKGYSSSIQTTCQSTRLMTLENAYVYVRNP